MQPANNRETLIRETPRNEQSLQNPQKHIGFNDSLKEEKTARKVDTKAWLELREFQ